MLYHLSIIRNKQKNYIDMPRKKKIINRDEVCMADLLDSVNGLRREVRKLKTGITLSAKQAYTNAEVMEMFDIGTATLKKWRDQGDLGFTLIGNVYLYSNEDIKKFLKKNHFDSFNTDEGVFSRVRA